MPKSHLESYPPLFRPTRDPDPNNHSPNPNPSPTVQGMDPLPVIDVNCLDPEELDRACRNWGIFRVINHGVPTQLLKQLQNHAKTIFDLPFEVKQGLNSSCIKYFWGSPALSPCGLPLSARNVDWVEGLNIPLHQLSFDHDDHHPLIPAFRELLKEYRVQLTRIGWTLFEGMVSKLKLELETPKMYLDQSTELVRVYRYPGCSGVNNEDEHSNGMHLHTDSSLLSILNEDEVGGLQFLKDDHWFDVHPIPSSLILNLGDMMQALSNDEYKSVKHKVKQSKEGKERVSICYFVFPQENAVINSSKYKPFTYNHFRAQVQLHLQTLGFKIGLQAFKLQH